MMKVPYDVADAAFMTSAATLSQCPADTGREVAFCGRSNAGKSSAINFLTTHRKLARTSKTPGRTQLINFFSLGTDTRLVDLPGYGYAKVPARMRASWQQHIDEYLRGRASLVGLILVMDIRHPFREFDTMMLEWGAAASLPVHVLLTKSDKLKRGPRQNTLLRLRKQLPAGASMQLFSATHAIGRDELLAKLDEWFS